jgi:hypothetical protein
MFSKIKAKVEACGESFVALAAYWILKISPD